MNKRKKQRGFFARRRRRPAVPIPDLSGNAYAAAWKLFRERERSRQQTRNARKKLLKSGPSWRQFLQVHRLNGARFFWGEKDSRLAEAIHEAREWDAAVRAVAQSLRRTAEEQRAIWEGVARESLEQARAYKLSVQKVNQETIDALKSYRWEPMNADQ